jgi:hypothetical protein
MADGTTKLRQDLAILKSMIADMTNYLSSDVDFWPAMQVGFPDLTLGGYIMRQRRLQILTYLLSESEQSELKQIVSQFNELTLDKVAVLQNKAIRELEIRTNQWHQNLLEYWDSEVIEEHYYKTDAEIRTMITDLVVMLGTHPYHLDRQLVARLEKLDAELEQNWRDGMFIWPEDWIPAYAKGDYWWLYGIPRTPENI